MTIKQMNEILKQMKETIKFKDNETDIEVKSTRNYEAYSPTNVIHIRTNINGIDIFATKVLKDKE